MAEGKNRQWILNARRASRMTGEEFRWNEDIYSTALRSTTAS